MASQLIFNETELNKSKCIIWLNYEIYPLDFGYYICGPILTTLIAIGIVGNALCLTILLSVHPRPIVTFYTVPLCICDFLVIIGSFLMTNLPYLLYGRMRTYGSYVLLYPYMNFFSNFAYTSCVWLVLLLSVERYFALCHPLKHKIYDARHRASWISILCLIAAFLYNLPRFFEINTIACFDLRTETMINLSEPAKFRQIKLYWIIYKATFGLLLLSIGPLVLLCFLSIRIWRKVKQSQALATKTNRFFDNESKNENRIQLLNVVQQTNSNSLQISKSISFPDQFRSRGDSYNIRNKDVTIDRQRKILANTLLCVLLKFLICHCLPAIIDLCETIMDEDQFRQPFMENIVDISTLFIVANSSFKIFIYALCSDEFFKRIRFIFSNRQ